MDGQAIKPIFSGEPSVLLNGAIYVSKQLAKTHGSPVLTMAFLLQRCRTKVVFRSAKDVSRMLHTDERTIRRHLSYLCDKDMFRRVGRQSGRRTVTYEVDADLFKQWHTMKSRKSPFVAFPAAGLALSARWSTRFVLAELCHKWLREHRASPTDQDGYQWYSETISDLPRFTVRKLASDLGLGTRQVQQALQELERLEVMRIGAGGVSGTYFRLADMVTASGEVVYV